LALPEVNLPKLEEVLAAGAIIVFEETRIRVRTLPIGGAEKGHALPPITIPHGCSSHRLPHRQTKHTLSISTAWLSF
jgi:hypothetical protein